jgi:hypothetical protein
METLKQYSIIASDYLASLLGDQEVEIKATEMSAKLRECHD